MRGALLFLGSGATVGSGIRKAGAVLPADDFFQSAVVRRTLLRGGYPALELLRRHVVSLRTDSLFVTWNHLFIQRGLARAGVLNEAAPLRNALSRLKRYRWPADYKGQAQHYRCVYAMASKNGGRFGPRSNTVALSELALWDLRLLIKEIYNPAPDVDLSQCIYATLWQALAPHVGAIVNFNYDTTFDRALTPAARRMILHPHGSLDWTADGIWEAGDPGRWRRRSFRRDASTPPEQMGYRSLGRSRWRLRYPLIVPAAHFKEEILGNHAQGGLEPPLLREWKRLAAVLARARRWIFIGFSFNSGDDHLIYLLRRAYRGQDICCSFYNPVEVPENKNIFGRLMEVTGYQAKICAHPIPPGRTIDCFLEKEDCPMRGGLSARRNARDFCAAVPRASR